MRYISDGTWFIAGTEATLLDDYRPHLDSGLFAGRRRCENPAAEGMPLGAEYDDEEVCAFSEFDVED